MFFQEFVQLGQSMNEALLSQVGFELQKSS